MSVRAAPPRLAVHHLQVSVADVDALSSWYVEKLGFKVSKRVVVGANKIVWIDIPGFRIGMIQVPHSVRSEAQRAPPPDDVMFQGFKQIHFSVHNVDDAYSSLKAEGVAFVAPPTSFRPPGIRLATFRDPEGNVISLYQDLDPGNALPPADAPSGVPVNTRR